MAWEFLRKGYRNTCARSDQKAVVGTRSLQEFVLVRYIRLGGLHRVSDCCCCGCAILVAMVSSVMVSIIILVIVMLVVFITFSIVGVVVAVML